MKNRDVASTLMGLTVACNMCGFATNFFERAWRDAPIPVTPIAYALNAAIAIFAPLSNQSRKEMDLSNFNCIGSTYGGWVVYRGDLYVR